MADELSSVRIKEVLALTDEKRAIYFFDTVKASKQIWILTDEHGCVMLNTEDEDCVPVWPNETFGSLVRQRQQFYLYLFALPP